MTTVSIDVHVSPAWQLRGDTERLVICLVRRSASSVWIVQVVRADEPLLSETYPDQASAMRRADYIRDNLIEQGWKAVPIREEGAPGCGLTAL